MPVHRCDDTSHGVIKSSPDGGRRGGIFRGVSVARECQPGIGSVWVRQHLVTGPSGPRQQNQGGHDPGHRYLALPFGPSRANIVPSSTVRPMASSTTVSP